MNQSEKKVSKWKIILLSLLAIAFIILIIFTFTKDCGVDQACFTEAFSTCSKASYQHSEDNNVYLYEIKGDEGNKCVLTVHLDKVGMEVTDTIKTNLENKGMLCEVGKETNIYNTKELNTDCTGPLKEAILQMTVERLYAVMVQTFGQDIVDGKADLPYDVIK
jgi:hypothetical protein